MNLSTRIYKIIDICINENEVSVNLLSKQLKVSTRTIFRELKEIEELTKPYGLTLSTKKEIRILGEAIHLENFKQELYAQENQFLSKEERQNLLTYEILKSKRLEKILFYANKFQVSEATISNDLNVVETWLQEQNLQLKRKSGSNIELIGDEVNYRKALSLMIGNNITTQIQEAFIDEESVLNNIFNKEYNSIMKLLNQEVIKQILIAFYEHKDILQLSKYSQSSYIGLIIHLSVAIDRIQKNEEIEPNEFAITLMKNEESFKSATLMAKYLETSFRITIPKHEIAYIAMHIQGAKLNIQKEPLEINEDMDYDTRLLSIVHQIIQAFPTKYNIREDNELVRSLLVHLKPTLIRIKYEMPILNPLIDEIISMYTELYEATKSVCPIIEDEYELTLNKNEIGFMTMHFGAAIERCKHKQIQSVPIRIGVVCSSGIGVSALLCARLKQVSDAAVSVEAYSIQEMLDNETELDIIVSTFDLTNYTNKCITINPLLKQIDVDKIKTQIKHIRMNKKTVASVQQDNIESIHYVSSAMLKLLNSISVHELTNIQTVNDLIDCSVDLLAINEEIKANIKQALYTREEMETMVFNDLGLALIHTRTSLVNHCIVKVLRFSTGSESLKNVQFGLLMLMNDKVNPKISKMMGKISSSLIEDQAFYDALKQSDSNEVYKQIEMKLKEHLHSLL